MLNSRLGLFTAALMRLHAQEHPFSRSYGVILPSSLTRVLSHTLDSLLDYLCRFAVRAPLTSIEAFLGSVKSGTSSIRTRHHSSTLQCADLPTHALLLGRAQPTARLPYPTASPISQTVRRWYRNINLLSIAYAYRPRLRSRLTLSGRAFLRKP